ncbi:hypothetical protein E3N88_11008 [Mikania micrantha]|uniref:Protein kinase domain-containing protein n=1 Tax=Mikania micrantha TaxID=192012 RepID=A0A5N6PEG9_9ASTR|nr:hypothetical protein E3N88_11008 [Mikania micrantha]
MQYDRYDIHTIYVSHHYPHLFSPTPTTIQESPYQPPPSGPLYYRRTYSRRLNQTPSSSLLHSLSYFVFSPACPNTVTIRRNPPRRAIPITYSAAPLSQPPSCKTSSAIRSFPIHDILSINIPDKQEILESAVEHPNSEILKVFLRIRPIVTQQKVGGSSKIAAQKNVWPQNPKKRDASKTAKVGGKKKNETLEDLPKECILMKQDSFNNGETESFKKPTWKCFSFEEIYVATNGFCSENMAGKGGYAEVYKGVLEDGQAIAVKRLTQMSCDERKEKEFLTEIGTLGHVY